jgi:hypothetical protein
MFTGTDFMPSPSPMPQVPMIIKPKAARNHNFKLETNFIIDGEAEVWLENEKGVIEQFNSY